MVRKFTRFKSLLNVSTSCGLYVFKNHLPVCIAPISYFLSNTFPVRTGQSVDGLYPPEGIALNSTLIWIHSWLNHIWVLPINDANNIKSFYSHLKSHNHTSLKTIPHRCKEIWYNHFTHLFIVGKRFKVINHWWCKPSLVLKEADFQFF